jgi:hypothetical protein
VLTLLNLNTASLRVWRAAGSGWAALVQQQTLERPRFHSNRVKVSPQPTSQLPLNSEGMRKGQEDGS